MPRRGVSAPPGSQQVGGAVARAGGTALQVFNLPGNVARRVGAAGAAFASETQGAVQRSSGSTPPLPSQFVEGAATYVIAIPKAAINTVVGVVLGVTDTAQQIGRHATRG